MKCTELGMNAFLMNVRKTIEKRLLNSKFSLSFLWLRNIEIWDILGIRSRAHVILWYYPWFRIPWMEIFRVNFNQTMNTPGRFILIQSWKLFFDKALFHWYHYSYSTLPWSHGVSQYGGLTVDDPKRVVIVSQPVIHILPSLPSDLNGVVTIYRSYFLRGNSKIFIWKMHIKVHIKRARAV